MRVVEEVAEKRRNAGAWDEDRGMWREVKVMGAIHSTK